MKLNELEIGQSARITEVGGDGALRQHFLDMGVIPGAETTLIKLAPMGDPMELQIHGYELTLRVADAANIAVEQIKERTRKHERPETIRKSEHPGLGETGKYHAKGDGEKLPDGTKLTFALVGNQNCGKTTLFNQLTGSNQHVGNFPGVTVDCKDGPIKGYPNTVVTDLPGIYSMSPYSSEEIVSRNFVLESKPRAIINIVDATNIERNMYLTMQLLDLRRDGEGERGFHDGNSFRSKRFISNFHGRRGRNIGVQPALHPMCRSHRFHQARTRHEMGVFRNHMAVLLRVGDGAGGAYHPDSGAVNFYYGKLICT
jgi:Fe2+ transport system protein FeoA